MSTEWRVGQLETRARAFGPDEWIVRTDEPMVTIRPGDDPRHIAGSWAMDNGWAIGDVRVTVIDY